MAKQEVMCIRCYKYYVGSWQSRYCPECRQKKLSETARKNNLQRNFGAKYTKVKDLEVTE